MEFVERKCNLWEVSGICGRQVGFVGGMWDLLEAGGICGR